MLSTGVCVILIQMHFPEIKHGNLTSLIERLDIKVVCCKICGCPVWCFFFFQSFINSVHRNVVLY